MRKRDKELLEVANDLVKLSKITAGPTDLHKRYDPSRPDSAGVLLEWYYRDAGKVLGGRRFEENKYIPR